MDIENDIGRASIAKIKCFCKEVCDEFCEITTNIKLKADKFWLDTTLNYPVLHYFFLMNDSYSHKDMMFMIENWVIIEDDPRIAEVIL